MNISLDSISVSYGKKKIIRDASIDILPGKLTTLVGANGCGKSTLLKTIARILTPSSGTVYLNGQSVHSMLTREVAKHIAFLPQGPVAPEGLKVRELVAQGRFPHQSLLKRWSTEDSAAVSQAMEDNDVMPFSETPVDELSGGQRQRCWIAMALAQNTDAILLDEPTTFLDLKVQVKVMSLLARIAREKGRTLLVVLHELNIAAAFSDEIIMMREGRIIKNGPPCAVMNPASIEEVFDLQCSVLDDPKSGKPICVPYLDQQ